MKPGAAAGRESEQRIELSEGVVDWAALAAGIGMVTVAAQIIELRVLCWILRALHNPQISAQGAPK